MSRWLSTFFDFLIFNSSQSHQKQHNTSIKPLQDLYLISDSQHFQGTALLQNSQPAGIMDRSLAQPQDCVVDQPHPTRFP
jgi:hypothetical protein